MLKSKTCIKAAEEHVEEQMSEETAPNTSSWGGNHAVDFEITILST